MDLISSNTGNGDGEIPSSNPVYTDFDQKRQTSDHGKSIHIQILPGVLTTCSQLLAKIAGYLVNLLGIFTDGVFFNRTPLDWPLTFITQPSILKTF